MWVSRSDRRILRLGVFKNPKWATTTISLAQKSFESQKVRKIPRSQRPKSQEPGWENRKFWIKKSLSSNSKFPIKPNYHIVWFLVIFITNLRRHVKLENRELIIKPILLECLSRVCLKICFQISMKITGISFQIRRVKFSDFFNPIGRLQTVGIQTVGLK